MTDDEDKIKNKSLLDEINYRGSTISRPYAIAAMCLFVLIVVVFAVLMFHGVAR